VSEETENENCLTTGSTHHSTDAGGHERGLLATIWCSNCALSAAQRRAVGDSDDADESQVPSSVDDAATMQCV